MSVRAASLNSNDVFVLIGKDANYLWCGKGSTGDEREIARQIATKEKSDSNTIYEGQEKPEFWAAIGGQEEYASDKRLAEAETGFASPRLFQISNATGNLKGNNNETRKSVISSKPYAELKFFYYSRGNNQL